MSRPLRVLHLVEGLDVGGAEQLLFKWAKACDRAKFTPLVLSLRDGILREAFTAEKTEVRVLKKQRAFDLRFIWMLADEIKKMNPDIINCHNGIPVISYGILAARIAGVPVVCTIHGRTHYRKYGFKVWVWFRMLNMSRKIITVAEGIKRELARLSRIPEEKFVVVYNGIERVSAELLVERKNVHLSAGDFVVGTIGNLRNIKGQKYLIEAMPRIIKNIPEAKLMIVGQGEEEGDLKTLVKQLGLDAVVIFTGYQKEAARMMTVFDVFVLPSLSEGVPMVLLEAMAARVPVVATKVGGIPEVVRDRETALLVGPEQSKAIADAVLELKTDTPLREKLTRQAFERVRQDFDIQKTFSGYEAIYRGEVLNTKH